MYTPSSAPHYNDLYYELLSVWDDNGNYDQVGISSDYCSTTIATTCQNGNSWTILWSEATPSGSSGCNLVYTWNAAAAALSPWNTYTFEMTLSGGNLNFYAYGGIGVGSTAIWSHSVSDSAGHFVIAGTYSCQSVNQYDFTNYEEVYNIANSMSFPQWMFQFWYTYYATTLVSSWTAFSQLAPSSPHAYYVDFTGSGGYPIRISNVAFAETFPTDLETIAPGNGFTANGGLDPIGQSSPTDYCAGNSGTNCPVNVGTTVYWTCTVPSGWTMTTYYGSSYLFSPITYGATAPSSASSGMYYMGCTYTLSTTSPNEYTTFIFYVWVS